MKTLDKLREQVECLYLGKQIVFHNLHPTSKWIPLFILLII